MKFIFITYESEQQAQAVTPVISEEEILRRAVLCEKNGDSWQWMKLNRPGTDYCNVTKREGDAMHKKIDKELRRLGIRGTIEDL